MRTRAIRDIPARLEGTRRRFDRWRRTRKGRSRIPKALWTSAVKAAGKYGLHPTVQALRLDYYALKKRIEVARQEPPGQTTASRCGSDRGAVTGFIELAPPTSAGSTAWPDSARRCSSRIRSVAGCSCSATSGPPR